MVDAVRRPGQIPVYSYDPEQITRWIQEHTEYEEVCCVVSGDLGFYSGAKALLAELGRQGFQPRLIPGISSLSCFFAKIGMSWEDATIASCHGREENIPAMVRQRKKVFVLLGQTDGVSRLARSLTKAGLGECRIYVGENLSYADETVFQGMQGS